MFCLTPATYTLIRKWSLYCRSCAIVLLYTGAKSNTTTEWPSAFSVSRLVLLLSALACLTTTHWSTEV